MNSICSQPPPEFTAYNRWQDPNGFRRILVHPDVVDRLTTAALRTLDEGEIGGILMGTFRDLPDGPSLVIDQIESVPSHQSGGQYQPFATAPLGLQNALVRMGGQPGPQPVGYFRTDTRDSLDPDTLDATVMESCFPETERVFILVRPYRVGLCMAAVFYGHAGRIPPFADFEFALVQQKSARVPASVVAVQATAGKRWFVFPLLAGMAILGALAVVVYRSAQRLPSEEISATQGAAVAESVGGVVPAAPQVASADAPESTGQPLRQAPVARLSDPVPRPGPAHGSIQATGRSDVAPKEANVPRVDSPTTSRTVAQPAAKHEKPAPLPVRAPLPAASSSADVATPAANPGPDRNTSTRSAPPAPEVRLPPADLSVHPPVLVKSVQPAIPPYLRGLFTSDATVDVKIHIDSSGEVTEAQVVRSTLLLSGMVQPAILAAARRHRFKPARVGERNVPSDQVLSFHFKR